LPVAASTLATTRRAVCKGATATTNARARVSTATTGTARAATNPSATASAATRAAIDVRPLVSEAPIAWVATTAIRWSTTAYWPLTFRRQHCPRAASGAHRCGLALRYWAWLPCCVRLRFGVSGARIAAACGADCDGARAADVQVAVMSARLGASDRQHSFGAKTATVRTHSRRNGRLCR